MFDHHFSDYSTIIIDELVCSVLRVRLVLLYFLPFTTTANATATTIGIGVLVFGIWFMVSL